MCYTATMPMEKKMIIFKGVVIGCLNSEYGLYNVASLWKLLLIYFALFGPLLLVLLCGLTSHDKTRSQNKKQKYLSIGQNTSIQVVLSKSRLV